MANGRVMNKNAPHPNQSSPLWGARGAKASHSMTVCDSKGVKLMHMPPAPPPLRPPAPLPLRPPVPLLLCALLLLLLPACGATVTPPPPVFLTIAGSTSMEPLLAELTTAYSRQHPHVTFDIQGGGSQLGHMLAEGGQVDIGLVSWPPQNLADHMRAVPIAHDTIAIILHPQNQSAGLSLVELRDIFNGRLLNWQAVDGPPLSIQVVSREDGSGTRAAFEVMVMNDSAVTPAAIVLPSSRAVVDFVAQTPNAIAYVSFRFVRPDVYAVPVEGTLPTLENLASNSYPLTRDLALIVPKQDPPEVNQFVKFVLSPAGQAIVGQKWGRVR